MTTIQDWHFVNDTLRDGSPIPEDGVKLVHNGKLELCRSGYHASERIVDALGFAPGTTLCRVTMSGDIQKDKDKLVASERTINWRLDVTDILRTVACQAALQLTFTWNCPEVIREFLNGNRTISAHEAYSIIKDLAENRGKEYEDYIKFQMKEYSVRIQQLAESSSVWCALYAVDSYNSEEYVIGCSWATLSTGARAWGHMNSALHGDGNHYSYVDEKMAEYESWLNNAVSVERFRK